MPAGTDEKPPGVISPLSRTKTISVRERARGQNGYSSTVMLYLSAGVKNPVSSGFSSSLSSSSSSSDDSSSEGSSSPHGVRSTSSSSTLACSETDTRERTRHHAWVCALQACDSEPGSPRRWSQTRRRKEVCPSRRRAASPSLRRDNRRCSSMEQQMTKRCNANSFFKAN